MSSNKKKRKNVPVWHRSAVEATLDAMPKYYGHACGTGAHGDAKYNRTKQKRTWHKELRQEETRYGGSLLVVRRTRQNTQSSVDVTTMPNSDCQHNEFIISNLAQHSIIANAIAPFTSTIRGQSLSVHTGIIAAINMFEKP
jgi:hypothetical protein